MTLGQKIKKLRSEKGLTQKDLADKVHVTFQTVSKWENDENEPDVQTLRELAKLFDCSMDYLLSEEAEEQIQEAEADEQAPTPAPVEQPVTKTIIIHQKEMHVCRLCNKDIPEDDLAVDHFCVKSGFRGSPARYRDDYYHKACLDAVNKKRKEIAAKEKAAKTAKSKKVCFGWGIGGGAAALIIALLIFLLVPACKEAIHPGLAVLFSVLISYAVFSDLYCILSGSYIGDVFGSVAGWSIRFPGLIFTWDLDGIMWLIGMKILFGILGFLFGVFVLILAVVLSAALSMVSFPFILIHNINNGYDDAF